MLEIHPPGQSLQPEVASVAYLPREQGIWVVGPEFSYPGSKATHLL